MSEFWQVALPVPGTTAAVARELEDAGWDGVFFVDTQNLTGDVYTGLALAAAATDRLLLGTGVTNPITRHPAVTASAITSIQVESGGRAVLGIGRGDSSLAYIGRGPAGVDLFERYVADVQQYLRGEPVDIDGFASHNTWIADTAQPKVPVDVAATGPRSIAAAAVHAERISLTVGADPTRLVGCMNTARAARAAAGLNPADLTFGAYINCSADTDVARARRTIAGSVGGFVHFLGMAGTSTALPEDQKVFDAVAANYDMANHGRINAGHVAAMDDDFVDRFAVAGSPSYCVDRLGSLLELGLTHIVFVTGSRDADPELVAAGNQRLATEVLPQLR
ncbi:MAG: LLM class flavin-dependent oxidoreductase [Acidimicrobiales bacterium]|jgi:5,10-methylenetetrahydromethanopterin reductase